MVNLNAPPTVSLTAPANSIVVGTGRDVAMAASAADSDGIQKVEFYRGSLLLATDTTAPYEHIWSNVATGSYTLSAKAYDLLGATTTSAAVTVTVRPVATVTVSPASPTAGSVALVTVDGAVFCSAVNVDFGDGQGETFINGSGLPITGTHAWATAGPKTITATGLGSACESQASTTTSVLVPPVVQITAPASGTQYTPPGTVPIAATATAGQGTVAKVDFYALAAAGFLSSKTSRIVRRRRPSS